MTPSLGIEPAPHWWEASALTTAPSLLPDVNPCDKFLVQSIAEASSSIPCRPVRKAELITPEIIGLILNHYGGSKNLLDVRFVCMCVLAFAGFFPYF